MPILAGLLVSLFGGLASWFAQWVTKKTALAAAGIATFALLTVGLYGALSLLLNGLVLTFPETAPTVLTLVWVALPDNAPLCVSVAVATDTAVALYRWNVENLRIASYIT